MQTGSNMQFIQSDPSLSRFFTARTKLNDKETPEYKNILIKNTGMYDTAKGKVAPGLGLIKNIFTTNLAEVTILSRYKNIIDLILTSPQPDSTNLLNMLNIKYVVSVPSLKSENFKLVHMNISGNIEDLEKTDAIKIYQNLKVLPRAFLVENCREVRSELEYKNILSDKNFLPEQVLLLDKSPEGHPCKDKQASPYEEKGKSVEIRDYQNNSLELQVKSNSKTFLFLSESYYPGWQATVNGKPTPIYRANYAFRALLLEPGDHQVRFDYNPMSFKIGAGLSLLTIMICAIAFTRKNL